MVWIHKSHACCLMQGKINYERSYSSNSDGANARESAQTFWPRRRSLLFRLFFWQFNCLSQTLPIEKVLFTYSRNLAIPKTFWFLFLALTSGCWPKSLSWHQSLRVELIFSWRCMHLFNLLMASGKMTQIFLVSTIFYAPKSVKLFICNYFCHRSCADYCPKHLLLSLLRRDVWLESTMLSEGWASS